MIKRKLAGKTCKGVKTCNKGNMSKFEDCMHASKDKTAAISDNLILCFSDVFLQIITLHSTEYLTA